MMEDINIPAKRCTCEVCRYQWISTGQLPPESCRNRACRSREWNGPKQLIKSHAREIKLPAPRKQGRPKSITLVDVREE